MITLEQARAFDALARHGTFAAAAAALNKRHTAIVYALRTLEDQTGLGLLDRRGYRTRLTPAGERILLHVRHLLAAERALDNACVEARTGWEPSIRLVFDGIFPVEPIVGAVDAVASATSSIRVDVSSEFLDGVERAFEEEEADFMIAVLSPKNEALRSRRLAPIRARLVAHRHHPLARSRRRLEESDLRAHVLLTVRGSDPRLSLSTVGIDAPMTVRLADFHAKKAGILAGTGFGWMPEYLVTRELERGTLVCLSWHGASVHAFEPRLYWRSGRRLGRAGRLVVDTLTAAT